MKTSPSKIILIIGGCGFVGSHLVEFLLDKYETMSIINCDALTDTARLDALAVFKKNPRHHFVKGRCDQGGVLDNIFSETIDEVVWCADEPYREGSDAYLRTGVMGLNGVLSRAAQSGSAKRVVFLGKVGDGFDAALFEAQSALVHAFGEAGLPVVSLIAEGVCGPYQHPSALPAAEIVASIKEKRPLSKKLGALIHIDDYVTAVDLVLHRGKVGDVYEFEKRVVSRPRGALLTDIGLKTLYSKETALTETLQWYIEHTPWWRGLL